MKRVLITGALGHLGGKLFDHLKQTGEFEVSGLDLHPSDNPAIHVADLGEDGPWIERLKGVDVVVHLAGDRDPDASWSSAIRNNMDATLALYHHAAAAGVKRVVLASSNWLHGGRRFGTERLTSDLPPDPINAYGMSKLFSERTGAYFASRHNLSVICLRIGWTQWTHGNKPGSHMAMGLWGQEMWLSDRDFLEGVRSAITAPNVKFAALNLMSNNPGMRWDIDETRRVIGFVPKDGSPAKSNFKILGKSFLKELFTVTIPNSFERKFPDW